MKLFVQGINLYMYFLRVLYIERVNASRTYSPDGKIENVEQIMILDLVKIRT